MAEAGEDRRKHLELIQLNIARMAASAFLYKSWMVAIIAALYAAYAASSNVGLILVALIPLISFWILDAFHLAAEKNFRFLYESARKGEAELFEMRPPPIRIVDWLCAGMSKTILVLYVPVLLFIISSYVLLSKG